MQHCLVSYTSINFIYTVEHFIWHTLLAEDSNFSLKTPKLYFV